MAEVDLRDSTPRIERQRTSGEIAVIDSALDAALAIRRHDAGPVAEGTKPGSVRSGDYLIHRYRRVAVLTDLAAGSLSALIAVLVRFGPTSPPLYAALSAAVPAAWVLIMALKGGYEERFLGAGDEEYRRIASGGLVLFMAIAIASYSVKGDIARGYVVAAVPATVAVTLASRAGLRWWLRRRRTQGHGRRQVLVVGRAESAASFIDLLHREPQHGLQAVGVCVPSVDLTSLRVGDVPVVGDTRLVPVIAEQTGVDLVAVVSDPELSGAALRRLSWRLAECGVGLVVSAGILEVSRPRLTIWPVGGLSLLHLDPPTVGGHRAVVKSLFDRSVGALLLVLLAPLMLLVAIAVGLSSTGPAVFRQQRVGANGRPFTMLKFRSMSVDAEYRRADLAHLDEGNGLLFKIKDDPRITPLGAFLRRYSLDELPQLINVVRGDMSLVGPRPPLPSEVESYDGDATRRLRVRPGLTGLWQVSGRSDLSQEESLRLDLRYVDNWSPLGDLAIICRTLRAVTRRAGAY